MQILGLDIERLAHDCFKIRAKGKVIYFDPYAITTHEGADFVLISHEHYDHCSAPDLMKIVKPSTIIVAAEECKAKLMGLKQKVHEIIYINPGGKIAVGELTVEAVPAYNLTKFKSPGQPFHPKQDKKCGFVLSIGGVRIYHAGDTDLIPEMSDFKNIDIALLPVSGTYVMTAEEAASSVDAIRPKIAIPMHYGTIVGTEEDVDKFWDKAKDKTKIVVL
jgi:L-ascorbate metabolism protein UlaG (beta-lactamase superfamily)